MPDGKYVAFGYKFEKTTQGDHVTYSTPIHTFSFSLENLAEAIDWQEQNVKWHGFSSQEEYDKETAKARAYFIEQQERKQEKGEREITSTTYENAQRRLNKQVESWLGIKNGSDNIKLQVSQNGEALFGVAGRKGKMTAREIIDDPSIKPNEPILAPDGTEVWGEITQEMADGGKKFGLKALPIKLLKGKQWADHKGFGLAHFYEEHGASFESRNFDIIKYLFGILNKSYQIYASEEKGKIRLRLVKKAMPRDIGVLELREEGGFYSVITAYPMDWENNSKVEGELIWQHPVPKHHPTSSKSNPLNRSVPDKAAGTARASGTKSKNNITDIGEKSNADSDDVIQTSLPGDRQMAPNSPEFKRWFGNSKVVDADGKQSAFMMNMPPR